MEIAVPGGMLLAESRGAGAAIVLLHGWSLDRRAWAPQLDGLADRFRLVAIDRRGFGGSSAPADLAAEPADLERLREALGLDRMILVGMSQGGRVALAYALLYPQGLAGLVLQGAPLDGFAPGPRPDEAIPLDHYCALVRDGEIGEVRALWGAHPLLHGAGIGAMLDDYDGRDLLVGEEPDWSLAGRLGEIDSPALIVTGEADTPWRQLVGDALAYGMPRARRLRLPGGHLCNLGDPRAYNDALAAFAAELAA